MFKKWFSILAVILVCLAGLSGCGVLSKAGTSGADSKVPSASPQQVVQSFYDAYYEKIGDRYSENFHNPLVEKTYRDIPYLSDDFLKEIDIKLGNPEEIFYDPFLCAQDIPGKMVAGEAVIDGDTAVVPVSSDWAGHAFNVSLQKIDGEWKITGIHCNF